MEIVLLIIVIVALIILRNTINENNSIVQHLKRSIDNLQTEIKELRKEITSLQKKPEAPVETKSATTTVKPPPVVEERKAEEKLQHKEIDPSPLHRRQEKPLVVEPPKYSSPIEQPVEAEESWFDKWLRNNPDIEKFIGENLINKIGIGVLVLGIAFFVRYAIDKDWINEAGRVGIGLLCGGILIGLAHWMRNSYRSFSSVLVGGGLTVFYFTIAFAFHEYHLLSQTVSFIAMVVITAFAVILSVAYDRIELAILASIGGFVTPFLLSTGTNNYIALFTYLSILNVGLLILAYLKNWRAINFIAFFFTLTIYGAWFVDASLENAIPHRHAFIFATTFYFMFVGMNIVNHFKAHDKLRGFDFSMLLIINLCYYSTGITILQQAELMQYKGLFTACLGVVNLILAYALIKKKELDKNFIYLLIGITITYISLTAPVQLKGNHITLFWAAEAVVLFWLYQRSFIKLVKIASALVSVLMLISLMIDWVQAYHLTEGKILPVIINKGFITTISSAIAMLLLYFLFRKEADTYYLTGIRNSGVKTSYLVTSIVLFFLAGALEINYQFTTRYPAGTDLNVIYLQLYFTAFATAIFMILNRLNIHVNNFVRAFTALLLFIFYLFNSVVVYDLELDSLTTNTYKIHLLANIASVVLLLLFIRHHLFYIRSRKEAFPKGNSIAGTMTAAAIIIIASIEIRNLYIWMMYSTPANIHYLENLYSKAGLSIIWGVASFILIWTGMRSSLKSLRLTGLFLFGITLVKLFTYDIQNMPAGGKIAAFILLGVLLLVVSFMYQRLKKLIIDNAQDAE